MVGLLIAAGILICFELGVEVLLRNPSLLPSDSYGLRVYHLMAERRLVQFLPECARWDEDVTYALRDQLCEVENRQGTVSYQGNSLGVRDDEESLRQPEIVVLGDSFAMGLGVAAEETFPSLLEELTGRRVLNLAISSHATVRQLRLLERVDRSRLRTLVIQYCSNDYDENLAFSQQGEIQVLSREDYDEVAQQHAARGYRFGHHLRDFVALRDLLEREDLDWIDLLVGKNGEDEAEVFLHALSGSGYDFSDLQIVLLEISSYGARGPEFLERLERARQDADDPALREAKVVDIAPVLPEGSYFDLDDHLTPVGHLAVAELLAREIAPGSSPTPWR